MAITTAVESLPTLPVDGLPVTVDVPSDTHLTSDKGTVTADDGATVTVARGTEATPRDAKTAEATIKARKGFKEMVMLYRSSDGWGFSWSEADQVRFEYIKTFGAEVFVCTGVAPNRMQVQRFSRLCASLRKQ